MARPAYGKLQQNANHTSENYMTKRAIICQRYFEHYQRQLEGEEKKFTLIAKMITSK